MRLSTWEACMSEKGGVLVVAETVDGALAPISAELVGAGQRLAADLGTTVTAALLGSGLDKPASDLAALGPARVLTADNAALADLQPDPVVTTLAALVAAEEPAVILFGHTPTMREPAIRLAYRLGTAITADSTGLRVEDGQVVVTKPVFGGAAIAEYANDGGPTVVTLRPRAFAPAEPGGATAEIAAADVPGDLASRTTVVDM